ncbi:ComEC/Rec2 family competence protein [Mycolicibacterium iranicum]|uniref:Metallo-beta-lactamase domain-containing protein n=1 Tax=Mycolicibacterium iranicum TaxID=912594 RepID=A0A178LVR2_MYCIR|nr:MBL fold metallo-hydrolase [Mycolicibacterium iranicum]OAN37682.1 hypothetical protein A4X20_21290 [Mycolicibacterium iranicum]
MTQFFDDDVIDVRLEDDRVEQYYWGEPAEPGDLDPDDDQRREVTVLNRFGGAPIKGFVKKATTFRNTPILRLSMVDVQQGDGLILETPSGKVVFIDGGDNKLFARRVAKAFPGTSEDQPLIVDAIVITHGDADHFDGLNELRKAETDAPSADKKIFVAPKRVYHNGIVKRPSKIAGTDDTRKATEMFGATIDHDGLCYVVDLVEDIRDVAQGERNGPFNAWAKTLTAWDERVRRVNDGKPIELRRIDHTSTDAFDFLNDGAAPGQEVTVEVLGPTVEEVDGTPALRFLTEPAEGVDLRPGFDDVGSGGAKSVAHTINGHSINFRLIYGNVRFLFTGDMNHEAMRRLRTANDDPDLQAEILKAPHHGSADYDPEFLMEVAPVVSIISSGDESRAKEYIHPRASLMASLGKCSREGPSIIFCTELAAFFAYKGPSTTVSGSKTFEGFERLNFGIIHIRTDGRRVLAFTHSGKRGMNEAYRFTVSEDGRIEFEPEAVKRSAPKKANSPVR